LREVQHLLGRVYPNDAVAKTSELECQKAGAATDIEGVGRLVAGPTAQTVAPRVRLRRGVQPMVRRVVEGWGSEGPVPSNGIFDRIDVKRVFVHPGSLPPQKSSPPTVPFLQPMPNLTSLRRIRESQFLSQQELADRSGIHRVTIANLEGGRKEARFSTLRKLAAALGVEPAALVQTHLADGGPETV
jgi:DNA-binding XRE family transcriptional regulator